MVAGSPVERGRGERTGSPLTIAWKVEREASIQRQGPRGAIGGACSLKTTRWLNFVD